MDPKPADQPTQPKRPFPWAALVGGYLAGVLSVLGYALLVGSMVAPEPFLILPLEDAERERVSNLLRQIARDLPDAAGIRSGPEELAVYGTGEQRPEWETGRVSWRVPGVAEDGKDVILLVPTQR